MEITAIEGLAFVTFFTGKPTCLFQFLSPILVDIIPTFVFFLSSLSLPFRYCLPWCTSYVRGYRLTACTTCSVHLLRRAGAVCPHLRDPRQGYLDALGGAGSGKTHVRHSRRPERGGHGHGTSAPAAVSHGLSGRWCSQTVWRTHAESAWLRVPWRASAACLCGSTAIWEPRDTTAGFLPLA